MADVDPDSLPTSTAAQRVIRDLWVLHYEKIRINSLVLAAGQDHIKIAWVGAMNAYRAAWKSNRARIREALRAECARKFKEVEALVEAHNRGEAPPPEAVSSRGRVRRQ